MTELLPVAFYFLRHGETDWNLSGLSQGRTDIPLNATGLAQARAAAEILAGHGIVSIVSSTLGRARQTAEIVAARLGLPFSTDPELVETAFGVQEGRPMGPWYDDWVEDRFTPEKAESFAELRRRVVPAVNHALGLTGPVLIIGHGAMFRALRAEMGLSAHVRTNNGVPLRCVPGVPWTVMECHPA